jgi:chloramphenicol O-acetyltransferase type B
MGRLLRQLARVLRRLRSARYTAAVRRTVARAGPGLRVNAPSRVNERTHLGTNVHMNGLRISGRGQTFIGDNFHSGSDCLILTQNHNYEGTALPYDSTYIVRDVIIGDNVWLGDRVIILPGAKIGEGAIIQAGSVVVGEIPRCGIAGGHPAKVFRYRDLEHYEKLKAERRFHGRAGGPEPSRSPSR